MGKSKRNKGGRGGGGADDKLDGGGDADSVTSMSSGLSDLQFAQATEHISSQEFVLDKYVDALYEKRGSTREEALGSLTDAFESFVLLGLVENKYVTLLSQFINSIKRGSVKEVCLACRCIGLLAITLGAGSSSHEIMDESHPHLLRVLQTWPDAQKMISALDCLAVVTFVGATDLAETQLSLKAIWDVIHPKSGSNVGVVRKPKPPLLAAAVSAWAFLLTTIGSSRRNTDSWKEPITFLCSLLEAEDRAVRIAAGEALALCFELRMFDVSSSDEADVDSYTGEAGGSKHQLFLNMQALKAKLSGLVYSLSMEAGGRGADKKNLNDQRDLFQRISDFIKSGECPEESLRISGKNGILRVTSWRESIQLNYMRRFLGRGFLKHSQDNDLLHEVFDIKIDRTENMSATEKKMFRSGEEKGRALKLNKERRLAQERKQQNILNEQYG
ncbi:interferon-related developmental regulator 2 [Zea mays]|uniref:Interferon-related developmental regulator 2 n=1 Tax=Zea mays TaxID=4577 RepID=B6SU26_MAIZE|nr:interferon-related developmental regulator 2 [Zea mays]ACG28359.1 interferon-related developmental regulator 2 [Zea mays]ACN31433.1 unknown [Zea mays]ONL99080.1 interferon-related developmental regulator family protein / IFRD protein family [Zea mays]ONL99082.1 interferon-related developmental regulator family protein / IFRD protein family [Zea mays]|eukprot:NP_001147680.1 interferon-related developmental regulator 2 [Zea mays]